VGVSRPAQKNCDYCLHISWDEDEGSKARVQGAISLGIYHKGLRDSIYERGREFARKPFSEAAKLYLEERKPHVAERTQQFEKERLNPLMKFFGENPLLRVKAEHISAYQRSRLAQGISGRTINMEVGVLRRMLKRARVWAAVDEDVKAFPEHARTVGKVLTAEQKHLLFETAGRIDHLPRRGIETSPVEWCGSLQPRPKRQAQQERIRPSGHSLEYRRNGGACPTVGASTSP
jgi:hypothetical protein